ncbi:hypothetical protein [Kribbella sp. NPDC051620]|uniref:hypothetical protein n=1 Tax=Kribbella sp. NPDC051620 TaxID=3364120 RepID=UPI0037AB6D7A
MPHDPDLTAALARLAAGDPLDPINPTALLERGRRGRRRRRVLSVSGVVAGVAAIAVGAALLPGALDTTEPEIAQTPKPTTAASSSAGAVHPDSRRTAGRCRPGTVDQVGDDPPL